MRGGRHTSAPSAPPSPQPWGDEELGLMGPEAPAGSVVRASASLALTGPDTIAPGNARGIVPIRRLLHCPEGAEQALYRPFTADLDRSETGACGHSESKTRTDVGSIPQTPFWKVARARLIPVVDVALLPLSLLDAFLRTKDPDQDWGHLSRFLEHGNALIGAEPVPAWRTLIERLGPRCLIVRAELPGSRQRRGRPLPVPHRVRLPAQTGRRGDAGPVRRLPGGEPHRPTFMVRCRVPRHAAGRLTSPAAAWRRRSSPSARRC